MFILVYRFIIGYLRIKIYGEYPERFINSCAANNIKLWNYYKHGNEIFVNIKIKDYLKIRKIRKHTNVKLKIIKRYGLPIIIKPYIKRSGLFIGFLIFIMVNLILSKFIWNIEVVGNKNIPSNTIIKYCNSIGIKEGVLSSKIDTNEARLKLLIKNEDLSWASFIIEGSHLTVNVSETKTVDKNENLGASNAVAKCDAVITDIKVTKGRAQVRKNQAVLKGEILVSGTIEYTDGRTTFVKSNAKIIGETKHSLSIELPYKKTVKNKTSNKRSIKILDFFGLKIPLTLNPITYKNYTKKLSSKKIGNDNAYLPIYIHKANFTETKNKVINLNKKQAYLNAVNELKKVEKDKLKNKKIINFNESVIYNDSTIKLIRNYKCHENIVSYEKIKINTVNY